MHVFQFIKFLLFFCCFWTPFTYYMDTNISNIYQNIIFSAPPMNVSDTGLVNKWQHNFQFWVDCPLNNF